MKSINDFESKMIHNGKRNIRHVLVSCERCGDEVWKQWHVRIRRGDTQYCSRECFDERQREQSGHVGKGNARFNLDKSKEVWYAYWWENGKLKNTTKAKWLWEQNFEDVPKNWVVTYIDGNSANCELGNLEIMSRAEWNKVHLLGHEVSDETRKKISIAHTGKSKWEGFVTSQKYPGLSKRRKSEVKTRDDFTCRICGAYLKGSSRAIVHHIDGDKTNQDMDNLIMVCRDCHALIHCRKSVSDEISAFRSMLKY